MKKVLLLAISFYRSFISRSLTLVFGHACRFEPTCSEYAYQAVAKYGSIKGGFLAVKRVLRCNPFVTARVDPLN